MILKIKLLLFQYVNTGGPKGRLFRVSKKWLNATFLSFTGFASRIRSRAAKVAKYENLWVFIRSDVHAVRAGLNIRGSGPLSTPRFIDRLASPAKVVFFCWPFDKVAFKPQPVYVYISCFNSSRSSTTLYAGRYARRYFALCDTAG